MRSARKLKILAIDDNVDILLSLRLLLKPYVEVFHSNSDPSHIPAFLSTNDYDVIMLDMNYKLDASSGTEGFYWIGEIKKLAPLIPIVCITAYGDTEKAVKAIRSGASDFVIKPWDNDKLLATILSCAELKQSQVEANEEKQKHKFFSDQVASRFSNFIGSCEAMTTVFHTIEKVGPTDANVLILGDNGTGKELVARQLHDSSERADEVFIAVDLGTINENLFESELFGHVKGAFTDAKRNKIGRFELAKGGTIFLDEIGNLSLPMQAKLLTVIERREVVPVGGEKPVPIDVRIVCATNSDLKKAVATKEFRTDLMYRINTVELILPPLRERGDDIVALAQYYLSHFEKKYKKEKLSFSDSALACLKDYSWPGNVRELLHAVERAVILSDSNVVTSDDFLFETPASDGDEFEFSETFNLDEIEQKVIRKVLKMHKGNISNVAKELGLSRAALYRRLDKYGL